VRISLVVAGIAAKRVSLRRGRRVRLKGRVRGSLDSIGRKVRIQVRVGGRWRTVSSAALRSDGSFSARWRVSVPSGARSFKIRAVVRGAGASSPLRASLRR
jgi:hypothetical protein